MNSEKQVVDLKKEELLKISKNKEECVARVLRSFLEQKEASLKSIVNLQECGIKLDAEIHKLEGLTVEDAYDLIQENGCNSVNVYPVRYGYPVGDSNYYPR